MWHSPGRQEKSALNPMYRLLLPWAGSYSVLPNRRRPRGSGEYLSYGSGNRHARLFRLDLLNHAHLLRRAVKGLYSPVVCSARFAGLPERGNIFRPLPVMISAERLKAYQPQFLPFGPGHARIAGPFLRIARERGIIDRSLSFPPKPVDLCAQPKVRSPRI